MDAPCETDKAARAMHDTNVQFVSGVAFQRFDFESAKQRLSAGVSA